MLDVARYTHTRTHTHTHQQEFPVTDVFNREHTENVGRWSRTERTVHNRARSYWLEERLPPYTHHPRSSPRPSPPPLPSRTPPRTKEISVERESRKARLRTPVSNLCPSREVVVYTCLGRKGRRSTYTTLCKIPAMVYDTRMTRKRVRTVETNVSYRFEHQG